MAVAVNRPWRWARSPITDRVHATVSRRAGEEEALCGVAIVAAPEVIDLAGADVCLICLQKLTPDRAVVQP
jgi:hypothetical protein